MLRSLQLQQTRHAEGAVVGAAAIAINRCQAVVDVDAAVDRDEDAEVPRVGGAVEPQLMNRVTPGI